MNRLAPRPRTARRAAVLATIGFAVIAIFQAVLAAGAPLGHAAWGGESAELSTGQRIGSVVSFAGWICAAVVVLGRAGFWARASDTRLFRWGTWFFAGITAISALVNLASQSRWENLIWGPVALALAVLCTIVARSTANGLQGTPATPRRDPEPPAPLQAVPRHSPKRAVKKAG